MTLARSSVRVRAGYEFVSCWCATDIKGFLPDQQPQRNNLGHRTNCQSFPKDQSVSYPPFRDDGLTECHDSSCAQSIIVRWQYGQVSQVAKSTLIPAQCMANTISYHTRMSQSPLIPAQCRLPRMLISYSCFRFSLIVYLATGMLLAVHLHTTSLVPFRLQCDSSTHH